MTLNPQKQSRLGHSKISSISKLVAYEAFLKQKQQRKTIEQQRKNIELNVANLYRQAKRASKQLTNTQQKLISEMNKKSQKQQQQRLKSYHQKLRQQELNQLKNNNSLSRYMGMLKRQQAKRRLTNMNTQFTSEIRQRQRSDQKLKQQRVQQQQKSFWQKNISQANNIKVGIQLSRAKSLYTKKSISSIVRNQLLEIQNDKIQRQRSTIQELNIKRNDLSKIFSKANEQNSKYMNLLKRGRNKSFVEMYDLAIQNQANNIDLNNVQKKRRKSRRKRKNFSQSRIKQVYFGEQSN